MKLPRVLRLGAFLVAMFSRPPRPRSLPEVFAADRGRFVARTPVTVPAAVCPLPDCSTCLPSTTPLDVVAEEQRVIDLAYASAWLVEHYPEVWYFEDGDKLHRCAAGIVAVRARVAAGRVAL